MQGMDHSQTDKEHVSGLLSRVFEAKTAKE